MIASCVPTHTFNVTFWDTYSGSFKKMASTYKASRDISTHPRFYFWHPNRWGLLPSSWEHSNLYWKDCFTYLKPFLQHAYLWKATVITLTQDSRLRKNSSLMKDTKTKHQLVHISICLHMNYSTLVMRINESSPGSIIRTFQVSYWMWRLAVYSRIDILVHYYQTMN